MRWLGLVLVALVALGNLGTGIRMIMRREFLSYHAEIAARPWASLDAGLQQLLLSMIHVMGAGMLAIGAALLLLALRAFRGERWAAIAIALVTLLGMTPTLNAAWTARAAFPAAQTPVEMSAAGIALALAGALLLGLSGRRSRQARGGLR